MKTGADSLENLIERVNEAYRLYNVDQLKRVHALLYVVYRSILENDGHNQYDMPHTDIRNHQNNGIAVEDSTVDGELVRRAKELVKAYRGPT